MTTIILHETEKSTSLNSITPQENIARHLIKKGWAVFPCWGTNWHYRDVEHKSERDYRPRFKAPRVQGGCYENDLTNPAIFGYFGDEWDELYPAICCYNVLVIDVDSSRNDQGETGVESFRRIQKDLGLCLTPSVRTPSGGEHYYFRIPRNFLFLKNTKLIYQGQKQEIDIKGFGGFVIAVGTESIDTKVNIGQPGRYELDSSIRADDRSILRPDELPEIPQPLLELLATDEKRPYDEYLKEQKDQNQLKIQMLKMTGDLLRSMYPNATDEELGIADPDNLSANVKVSLIELALPEESPTGAPDSRVQSDSEECDTEPQIELEATPESDTEASECDQEADIDEVNIYDGLCQTDGEFENRVLCYIHPDIRTAIKRMKTTLPLDSAAIVFFTILGSQIRAQIYHNKKWRKIVFHSMLVGRTGAGKDDLLDNVTYAIEKLQIRADNAYKQEVRDYRKKMKEFEKQEQAKTKREEKQSDEPVDEPEGQAEQEVKEPKEPIPKHYILSSSITIAGIFDQLTQMDENGQPGGLSICTGEGDQVLEDLQKFSSGGGDFSTILRALDGKYIRTGYKHSKYLAPDPKLSLCLVIQPETLAEHFQKKRKQICQGFFSRFFYNIVPKEKHEPYDVDTESEPTNPPDEQTYEEKLLEIILGANQDRQLRFSTEDGAAKEVYQEHADWVTDTYNNLIESDDTIDVFISSFTTHSMDWVRNVAGIAHVLNQAALVLEKRPEELSDVITGDEMRFAVAFFKHYRTQFLGFVHGMGSLDTSIREDAKKVMRKIIAMCSKENKTEVSWSKVKDQFPTMLKGKKHLEYAERLLKYLKSNVLIQAKEVTGTNHKTSIAVACTPAGRRLGSC